MRKGGDVTLLRSGSPFDINPTNNINSGIVGDRFRTDMFDYLSELLTEEELEEKFPEMMARHKKQQETRKKKEYSWIVEEGDD